MAFRETEYLGLDDAIGIHDLILESMGDLAANRPRGGGHAIHRRR